MKNKPTISIIVPIFNTEKYLTLCIQSILEQTFTDFELILVNDGSTDNCGDICDNFALKDKRIKVFHKKNGGESTARNLGLSEASGTWIGFVDSDDICEKDMYEILIDNALKHNADISACKIRSISIDEFYCRETKKTNDSVLVMNAKQAIKNVFSKDGFSASTCNKIYKRDIMVYNNVLFDEDVIASEDAIFLYHIIKHSSNIVATQRKLYNYIQHDKSYTKSGKVKDKITGIKAFSKIIKEEKDIEISKSVENLFLGNIIDTTCYNILHVDFNKKYHRYLTNTLKINLSKILCSDTISIKYKLYSIFVFYPRIFSAIIKIKKVIREFRK